MQSSILSILCCPSCRNSLAFKSDHHPPDILNGSEREEDVLEASLLCRCGRSYPIRNGVPNLVYSWSNEFSGFRFTFDRLFLLSQIERRHFWFAGRRMLIERLLNHYLKEKVGLLLDLGCGTGFMLERLAHWGDRVVGLDRRPEGLHAIRGTSPKVWLIQGEATRLPLKENVFDAVVVLDVLEHVDDRILLQEVQRVLRQGGLLVLTVPAMPWLWSLQDEAAGHLRRYTHRDLMGLLTGTTLQVLETGYFQFLLFPLMAVIRLLGRVGFSGNGFEEKPLPVLNKLLTWINRLEVVLGDRISWPWGSSLFAVCRRSRA